MPTDSLTTLLEHSWVRELYPGARERPFHIENIDDQHAKLTVFRHEQDFSLYAAFGAMSDAMLGNTPDLKAEDFASVPRSMTEWISSKVKSSLKFQATKIYPIATNLISRDDCTSPINHRFCKDSRNSILVYSKGISITRSKFEGGI